MGDAISDRITEMEAAIYRIGRGAYDGPSLEFSEEFNLSSCRAFGVKPLPRGTKGPHGQLLVAILRAAQDPDEVVGE